MRRSASTSEAIRTAPARPSVITWRTFCFHLACGLLLFGVIRRTIAHDDKAAEHLNAERVAGFAVLLWLVHPIQTDAVDYVIQRTELIVSLCYVATLYASIRAWDATKSARPRWMRAVGRRVRARDGEQGSHGHARQSSSCSTTGPFARSRGASCGGIRNDDGCTSLSRRRESSFYSPFSPASAARA